MNNNIKKNNISLNFNLFKIFFVIIFSLILINNIYAENLNVSFNYGLNNVARSGIELPVNLIVDNKDSQDFTGKLALNIYENNQSVFVYANDLNIGANSSQILNFNISLSNKVNTLTVDIYNKREEIVLQDRTNIDLSNYNYKLIVGILSNDYEKYSYIDNVLIENTNVETKIVKIEPNYFENNFKLLNLIDMLIITDFNYNSFSNNQLYNLKTFAETGKPIFMSKYSKNKNTDFPEFINSYINNSNRISIKNFANLINYINANGMNIFIAPFLLNMSQSQSINLNFIKNFLNDNFVESVIKRYVRFDENTIENDYYNIGNLLNIVDKEKLPDIFILSIVIVIYVLILVIGIYGLLRNIDKRASFGKYLLVFSSVIFILILFFLFNITEKSASLTYISIVDINNNNTNEKAFLNFRINDNKDLNFSVDDKISLYPLLKLTNEPIRSFNFLDFNNLKKTTFEDYDDRMHITVENANNLDPSIFVYNNDNYLNDVYNIACQYQRFDGAVTGRIANNMGLTIRNAHILMQGKILDIGDIEPNYSISLSRARVYGAPVGNNEMLADMLADTSNHNILKYYLDENVKGNYDYALFFGFIDTNATLDIKSNDVGNIYGKTLIVLKINDSKVAGINDLSGLNNSIENIQGFYNVDNNSIRGDEQVINKYHFDENALISKIYIEPIESYDYGTLDANVPFYGDIYVYNVITNQYDVLNENTIQYDELNKYLTNKNEIIFAYTPTSRDPLYRMISLPIPRAIAAN